MTECTTRKTIADVFSRVLEEATFLFPASLEDADIPNPENWDFVGVSINFQGNPSGKLNLWTGIDFAQVIAANMLGIDEDSIEARERQVDALKEFLNIIAGNFLTAHYGNDLVFNLGIPETVSADSIKNDFENPGSFWLQGEDYPLLFTLTLYDQGTNS